MPEPTTTEILLVLIKKCPGRSETELAHAIYGNKDGYQQRVNQECRTLAENGLVERRGENPYRYYAIKNEALLEAFWNPDATLTA